MALSLALCLALAAHLRAQDTAELAEMRKTALDLAKNGKAVAAKPLFEKLAEAYPQDFEILDNFAIVLLTSSASLSDPAARRKERVRARQIGERARAVANGKSGYWQVALQVPEDGGESSFSAKEEVERLMRDAEADFAKGDMDKAFDGYTKALAIEPQLYWAALFCGDVRYKQGRHEEAWPWFARAIEIDPRVETAYRYWADSLLASGKLPEARAKAIDAVLADPYTRWTWNPLTTWASKAGVQIGHPHIESPNSIQSKEAGKTTISIDPSLLGAKDGREKWMMYEISKAAWTTNDNASFKKAYPEEGAYRHSLQEEAQALGLVAVTIAEAMKKGDIKSLHPSLQPLLKLHEAGLLEAYILFARADQGIAKDYLPYKEKNADKLRKYLEEWVAPLPSGKP